MKTLEFFAHGTPKAQPRARACIRGKHAGVFDPGTADGWKYQVRAAAKDKWDGKTMEGPLNVTMTFYFPRPKAHLKANGDLRLGAPAFHAQKPDRDNCEKAVLDALTGLGVFKDDCQVCGGPVLKRWSPTTPGVLVRISEAVELT